MQAPDRSSSQSLFWPTILAVGLHVLLFAMLFVSFAMTPELPPSRPVVQVTLYQMKSQSPATTQTNQKIAGEQQKTSAPTHETEQLEQRKAEQERLAKAREAERRAAEQKQAEQARKAEQAAVAARKAQAEAEAKKAEQQRQAAVAKKKAAEEAEKKKAAAEAAKKKAAEEAAKKKAAAEAAKKQAAAEAAKKKAAEDAKKKAAAEAAKKKAAEEARRKAAEDKKAQALAELLSEDVGYQQAMADEVGDQVAGNFDDLIRRLVSESWSRPPSARNGMSVEVRIEMLPDGTITNATVSRSSGDRPFDNSAVAAIRNVGRIPEMQGMSPADFNQYRSFRMTFTPEDLDL